MTEILEKRLEAVTGILGTRSVQVSLPFIAFNIPKLMGIGALWKYEAKNEPALLKGNFPSRIEYLAHHLQVRREHKFYLSSQHSNSK